MDSNELRLKIEDLLQMFGMSGRKASEIMNVKYDSFRKRMAQATGHHFSEDNYTALVSYIKSEAEKL